MSLPAATALAASPATTVILPGGGLRVGEGSFTGPITESTLQSLRVDTAVVGCCGVSLDDGISAYDVAEAAVKRAAMASAQRTILVAESAKFTRVALAVVSPLANVNILVTDTSTPNEPLDAARQAGVTVHQA